VAAEEEGAGARKSKLEELAEEAPRMNCSMDEYIDRLALWLRDRVGVYTPDLLMALLRVLAEKRDRRLKYVTRRKVLYRLAVLEKKGLIKLVRL